jgi:hypothetical protein
MNTAKTIHHEGHEEHEDFCELSSTDDIPANPDSCDYMTPDIHQQGNSHLLMQHAVFLRGLRVLRGSNEVFA